MKYNNYDVVMTDDIEMKYNNYELDMKDNTSYFAN